MLRPDDIVTRIVNVMRTGPHYITPRSLPTQHASSHKLAIYLWFYQTDIIILVNYCLFC